MAKEKLEKTVDNTATDFNKAKALEAALSQITKAFGKESICKLGEGAIRKVDSIPTGALALDLALGVGGIPRGRVIEIYGPEAGGKTTLSLHIAAEAQKKGVVAFIDAEHALDPVYAKGIGVNVDELLVSQPDSGEQALSIAEKLVSSGAVDLIIIDSVAALVPQAEIKGEMGDSHMGLQARLMSQALRKLTSILGKTKTSIIFINQVRQKIGIMFGNPETTPGGLALKFYASVRIDVRKIENIKKGDEIIGTRVRAKVTKNKVAPPYRQAEFLMLHGEGISNESGILDLGVQAGFIDKSGTWFIYGDEKLGQGADNARIYLKDNPELRDEIVAKLKDKYLNKSAKEDQDAMQEEIEEEMEGDIEEKPAKKKK
ncbi:recombination protein RecA [Parelusimicrobium proximum]|uniref:recombinase RecA n=1 Tax=Parelusimicrobium proximum TaxID=3228953 RepID=UPI003D17CA55